VLANEGKILSQLVISEYRNIGRATLEFSPQQNIFIGQNAHGKTNLLEVIYLLATGRSFRTLHLDDVFPWSGGVPRAQGFFKENHRELTIEVELSQARRVARVNGAEKARLTELLGLLQVIEILPQDILLIDGEPSRRRRFLDIAISQWDPRYYLHLLKYQQGLRQRNRALQQHLDFEREKVRIWNKILEENGSYLVWQRKRVVKILNEKMGQIYPGMTERGETAQVGYKSFCQGESLGEISNDFCNALLEGESRDLSVGFSTIGPHRDDLTFTIQGKETKSFASEGQKRSLVIALKLSLGVFLKEVEGKNPIFILDDVLTQLDDNRRRGLMRALNPYQSFFSITSIEFHRDLIPDGKWFKVKDGQYEEFTPELV
jgi:DNA replication and repair protein RecF